MPRRTTISIPDDLHKEMMENREYFNFSRIFQEAMREKLKQLPEIKRLSRIMHVKVKEFEEVRCLLREITP